MNTNKIISRNPARLTIIGSLGLAVLPACKEEASLVLEGEKPNILICMADDQSWLHSGAYGCNEFETPNIDRLAASGTMFTNAYCSCPACAPSRASLLNGRNFWELKQAANHFSFFPSELITYTDLLKENGYFVGFTGKGWAPGLYKQGGRTTDPTGTEYNQLKKEKVPKGISDIDYLANFKAFYNDKGDQPFCFWFGSHEAHRIFDFGTGKRNGMDINKVTVPGFLPDHNTVKMEILDYYYELQHFDTVLGEYLAFLEEKGELENTLIIYTSDNGMPFPRAKSNLYDHGTKMPLVISWKGKVHPGRSVSDFVGFHDFAPTILEAAGVKIPEVMSGSSLWPILVDTANGRINANRDKIVFGKEMHAWCRPGGQICPVRGIRNDHFLYIWNPYPDLWPAGHPDAQYSWDLLPYGDVDWSPTKEVILDTVAQGKKYFNMAMGKRPVEEFYDVVKDPFQLNNLADNPRYRLTMDKMRHEMIDYLIKTGDPRLTGGEEVFDEAPYFYSHGLETATLPLWIWDSLSAEEQQQKIAITKEKLEKVYNGEYNLIEFP